MSGSSSLMLWCNTSTIIVILSELAHGTIIVCGWSLRWQQSVPCAPKRCFISERTLSYLITAELINWFPQSASMSVALTVLFECYSLGRCPPQHHENCVQCSEWSQILAEQPPNNILKRSTSRLAEAA
jgi:hypothetical protein